MAQDSGLGWVAGTVGVIGSLGWSLVSSQAAGSSGSPWEIPVLVVGYFPVAGDRIDIKATGDWGESLAATREKTERVTREVIQALEEGSRYHGYQDASTAPSLRYRVVETLEFLEPLPVKPHQPGKVPMTDYRRIMERVDIRKWVEERGAREVWLWGYHGGKVELWESNMASPFGDVSNSDRNPDDLPVEDWRPDGSGRKQPIDSRKWGGNSLEWFAYWMQNLPGQKHGLSDRGRRLTNWWVFVGHYDSARKQGIGLVE